LSTVTQEATVAIDSYRYAEAARVLYDFAWDHFCSYYLEMAKARLQDPSARQIVQQVLAHTLDSLLRLLHPIIPFVTEAIWQQFAKLRTRRLMNSDEVAAKWLMLAPWPKSDPKLVNASIEEQFQQFAGLVGAIREIRSRQNIAPKETVTYCVRCDQSIEELLSPMTSFIESMAGATCSGWGSDPQIPALVAQTKLERMEILVDLGKFIDVDAEIARNEKLLENLVKQIQGKEGKLSNETFVSRAPWDVVQKERESLADLIHQRDVARLAIDHLKNAAR
jgi:valyl-tRNA synthetase